MLKIPGTAPYAGSVRLDTMGGKLSSDSGNGEFSSALVIPGGGVTDLTVDFGSIALTGGITDNGGAGGLRLLGGTLVLDHAGAYTGGTVVSGGRLLLQTSAGIGSGPLTLTSNGTLSADASNLVIANDLILAGNAYLDGGANGRTFTFNGPTTLSGDATVLFAFGTTFNGAIGESGGTARKLTLFNSDVTLATGNTFTGGLVLQSTVASFATNATAGTGAISLVGNSTLKAISGNRQLANDLVLSDQVVFSGTSGATWTFNGGAVLAGNTSIAASTPTTFAGVISETNGPQSLQVFAFQPLTFSGNNTYTGGFSGFGSIKLGSNTALGAGSIAFRGGGTTLTALGARTLSNPLTLGGSAVTLAGTDTLTFTGSVNVSSNTSLFPGVGMYFTGNLSGSRITLSTGTLGLSGDNSGLAGVTFNRGTLILGSNTALGSGTFNFNGGTLRPSQAVTIANNITMVVNSLPIFDTPFDLVLNGTISSSNGSFSKTGSASLTLNGATSAPFGVDVEAGKLIVNNTLAVAGAGVTVLPGATLGGTGSITAGYLSMIAGSTIAPGVNGPGTLTLNLSDSHNSLFLGGTIAMQITGTGVSPVAGVDFDSINFSPTTTVQFAGPLTIDFASALTQGATYALFNFSPGNSFGTVGGVTITGAYNFSLINVSGNIWKGGIFTFDPAAGTLVAVPESSAWGMFLGAGLVIMIVAKRRRRN
jgi:autotransporter-associated beta strand protein